jgi:phosphoribosyl 1,2-cyclic phosphodiesterase
MLARVRIRFWGTRGSIATPGPTTLHYGGNTSCVELRSDAGTLVVLDCGTGARPLGQALAAEEDERGVPLRGTILLGHTHWDHIQGLPFFEPLFRPGRWDVYGPRGLGTSLDQTLAGQMNYQYFPVALDQLGADIEYHELIEGTFEVGDLVISTQYLNHPALTLGYRIEGDGAVLCYVADHEPFDPALGAGGDVLASAEDAHHVEFLRGADVLVHDAQYGAEEYKARVGWGHSTVPYVVDVACAAGVGRTVLFHHDPMHDDGRVERDLVAANAQAAGRTTVLAAAEGDVLEITPAQSRADGAAASARPAGGAPVVAELRPDVVIVAGDRSVQQVVAEAARSEDLGVVDAAATPDIAGGNHVVVIDVDDPDAVARARALLAEAASLGPAVVAVSRHAVERAARPFAAVTHWLVWPATTAHVRTKLRAAVLGRACRWLAAPAPGDEEARLHAVHALGLLDTPPEPAFDEVTDRVAREFHVPIALITLVDRDRQWFLGRHGFDEPRETPRDESFCAHTILGDGVLQVPDTLDDERFADNPSVTGALRVRFYAGAPIVLTDGSHVGSLCIVDHRPRLLDAHEAARLRALADEVAALIQAQHPAEPVSAPVSD